MYSLFSLASSQCRSLFSFAEREPVDLTFARSDVAQLHRLHIKAGDAVTDDATWKDLLLETYHAELSREVSIAG